MYVSKLSSSRIDTFDRCIFKYFLTYEALICEDCGGLSFLTQLLERGIDLNNKQCSLCGSHNINKPYMKPSFAAQTGSVVHKVLEIYARDRKNGKLRDWKEDLVQALSVGLDNTVVPDYKIAKASDFSNIEPQCQTCSFNIDKKCKLSQESIMAITGCPLYVYKRLYKMIDLAIQRYDKDYQNKLISVEQKFDKVINNDKIGIIGFFDAVFKHDQETIEIVDYKSGNYTYGYEELLKATQPRIYSLAAKILYPEYKHVLLTFDYFTKSPITVTFTSEEDKLTEKYLIKKWNMIRNHRKLVRYSPKYFVCRYMCDRNICDIVWDKLQQINNKK